MIGIPLIKSQKQKIQGYYSDPNIAALLLEELNQIQTSVYGELYTLTLTSQKLHLYLYYHRKQKNQEDLSKNYNDGSYVIRIGKSFPIERVRIHVLKNKYIPKIFDCRDLLEEIFQSKWDYKKRLVDVLRYMERFEEKLAMRNNNALAMQQTGKFILHDVFTTHELSKFESLQIFQDTKTEDGPLLGTTETHFLIFKVINNKYTNPHNVVTQKLYQLIRVCQLQCISQINYNHKTEWIILTLCKYKTIKNFNEYQKITKRYKLNNPELFLRNILKNITQFQRINIGLAIQPVLWKEEEGFSAIEQKMVQCKELEEKYYKNEYNEQKEEQKMKRLLVENYQKIISYFSERVSSYYLIFVNKLNGLYRKEDYHEEIFHGNKSQQRKFSDNSIKSNDSEN